MAIDGPMPTIDSETWEANKDRRSWMLANRTDLMESAGIDWLPRNRALIDNYKSAITQGIQEAESVPPGQEETTDTTTADGGGSA